LTARNADCQEEIQEIKATFRAATSTGVPVYVWPESKEQPEKTEPPHGEGSGESVLYIGIHSDLSTNSSNASTIIDSGASGVQPLPTAMWLPNDLNIVTTTCELTEPFPVVLPTGVITRFCPDSTQHLTNPSMIKQRRAYTRRS
jgi:hypothetical protein